MDYKEEYKNDDIYLTPKGEHNRTLLWLHGLGDSAEGFVDVFKSKKVTPVDEKTKVILLTAPVRAVTLNFGMEMPCWVGVIKKEVEENLGGDYKKLMIGGFSQGAALSLYTACRLQENIGAVIFCSGHPLWANPAEEILSYETTESKTTLPIFAYHGKADPLLPFSKAFKPIEGLKEKGFNITSNSEDGMGHSMSAKEWKLIKEFIDSTVC